MRRTMASEVAARGNTITKEAGWSMWALADKHLFLWQVSKPRAICVAQDPRNYKPHVSLRAFRRTRVIWLVAHPQKQWTISGGEVRVYLDQDLFCEWNITRLCTWDGGMSQVCVKPGIAYKSVLLHTAHRVFSEVSSYTSISRKCPLSSVVARPHAERGGILWR